MNRRTPSKPTPEATPDLPIKDMPFEIARLANLYAHACGDKQAVELLVRIAGELARVGRA